MTTTTTMEMYMTPADAAMIMAGGWACTMAGRSRDGFTVKVTSAVTKVRVDERREAMTHSITMPDGSVHQGWHRRTSAPTVVFTIGCPYCGVEEVIGGCCANCGAS